MKIFAGRYSWDGKKHTNKEPVAWFPGAYNLKIFNISEKKGGVKHLKPYVCIYSKTGEGLSISENPEKFAQHICSDFALEMDKVLWAEELREKSGEFEVVVFTRNGRLGETLFYRIDKRKPLAGEQRIIEKELADLK
jgi:hypothetical protein